ncbi:MAG: DNA mismatch repair protein MutS [Candidatus Woesearchaeota archaeon]
MESLTPAMQQYNRIKKDYKDCILMFRMGDFYEMFYDDAKVASEVLGITLTSRTIRGIKVPLAGVPYHAVDPYIAKFVKKGHKLAICEQMEDPKLAKGVVKRDVVRVVTPGTVIDSGVLDERSNNYIMSIYQIGENNGVAVVDLSTGEFIVSLGEIDGFLASYSPSEILVPYSLAVNSQLIKKLESKAYVNLLEDCYFEYQKGEEILKGHFKTQSLEGFGLVDKLMVSAAGSLLLYLKSTQKNSLEFINKIRVVGTHTHLQMDLATVQNLELLKNSRDSAIEYSLLWVLDKTKSAMGARLIKRWIQQPLIDLKLINARLDSVDELINKTIVRKDLQAVLAKTGDIERIISRVAYGKCTAIDLVGLKDSLRYVPLIKKELAKCSTKLLRLLQKMDDVKEVVALLEKSIKSEPSAIITEGNMIMKGFNAEVDELHEIRSNSKEYIKSLEQREIGRTGIKNLRVRYNKVFGYYIEITKANLGFVPSDYIRKQTLVNCERYVTPDLKEREEMIVNAEERIWELEKRLFMEVVRQVSEYTKQVQDTSKRLAHVDVLCSLAHVAVNNSYHKPCLDNGGSITIGAGRHPVLELATDFVPNDCMLNKGEIMIITGPNMAGKSTYMRQVALTVVMAQLGSFVPANKAAIGVVDRIFTRVGASDDLARGQSTFMVEMTQTANIMNNATAQSLVILDEIGRGTSTYDGVSIAWSVVEYVYKRLKCKTMFATHYHVLNKLADSYENIKNYNFAVKEDEGDVVFLRRIVKGGTDRSYGIHVAKIAGMPAEIVERAKEIQKSLEEEDRLAKTLKAKRDVKQLSLTDL